MVTMMAYMINPISSSPELKNLATSALMASFQARAATSPKAAVIRAAIFSITSILKLIIISSSFFPLNCFI